MLNTKEVFDLARAQKLTLTDDPLAVVNAYPDSLGVQLFDWLWGELVEEGRTTRNKPNFKCTRTGKDLRGVEVKRQAMAAVLLDLLYYDVVAIYGDEHMYTRKVGLPDRLSISGIAVPSWYRYSSLLVWLEAELKHRNLLTVSQGWPTFQNEKSGYKITGRPNLWAADGRLLTRLELVKSCSNLAGFFPEKRRDCIDLKQNGESDYLRAPDLLIQKKDELGKAQPWAVSGNSLADETRRRLLAVNRFNVEHDWTAYRANLSDALSISDTLRERLLFAQNMDDKQKRKARRRAAADMLGVTHGGDIEFRKTVEVMPNVFSNVEVPVGVLSKQSEPIFKNIPVDRRGNTMLLEYERKLVDPWHTMRIAGSRSEEMAIGRMYWSMSHIQKALRFSLQVNGESTVEWDFKNMHPKILYGRAGIKEVTHDLYDYVCDEVGDSELVLRPLVKVLFNAMINAKTPDEAFRAANRSMYKNPHQPKKRDVWLPIAEKVRGLNNGVYSSDFLMPIIRKVHAPIADYFCTGIGVELQAVDAEIALRVMERCTQDYGQPVVGIHDSFRVQESAESSLRQVMREVSEEILDGTVLEITKS